MKQDFTQGNPGKVILMFALPMLIGNIFQQLYSTVDTMVVGNFVGKNAIAAVGGTFSIQFLILSIAIGFTSGMSIVISQLYGAKDAEKLKKAYSTGVIFVIILSIVLSVVGIILTRPALIYMLQTPEEIYADSYKYLFITFIGFPALFIYNMYASVLRAIGDSKTPLYFLILSTVVNIVLDLVFVIQLHMGVSGVAIATLIAQCISAVACHIYVGKRFEILKLTKDTLCFDKEMLMGIIKYGVPSAVQQSVLALNFMIVQRFVNFYGSDMIAAYSVVNKIENFVTMPIMNLALALSMFAGQNIGAGEEERAKKGVYDTMKIQAIFCAFVFLVLPLISNTLLKMFGMGDDQAVIKIGIEAISLCSKFYVIFALFQVINNFLRGVGDAQFSMFTTICMILIRLPITYVLVYMVQYGEISIWIGMIMGWATISLVGLFRFFTGGWKGKAFAQARK